MTLKEDLYLCVDDCKDGEENVEVILLCCNLWIMCLGDVKRRFVLVVRWWPCNSSLSVLCFDPVCLVSSIRVHRHLKQKRVRQERSFCPLLWGFMLSDMFTVHCSLLVVTCYDMELGIFPDWVCFLCRNQFQYQGPMPSICFTTNIHFYMSYFHSFNWGQSSWASETIWTVFSVIANQSQSSS